MPAKGTAEWRGDVPTGTGTFTAGDSISGGYTFRSRFEDGPGSNPEQLIAAAHASCFSMALSDILAEAGHAPDSVQTEATVTLRQLDGVPTITKIALVTIGRVPGIDEEAFVEHALAAKAGCPVSRALAGYPRSRSMHRSPYDRGVHPGRRENASRALRGLAVTPANR
jgi:lipoyl-dependent peroxiredoxin